MHKGTDGMYANAHSLSSCLREETDGEYANAHALSSCLVHIYICVAMAPQARNYLGTTGP